MSKFERATGGVAWLCNLFLGGEQVHCLSPQMNNKTSGDYVAVEFELVCQDTEALVLKLYYRSTLKLLYRELHNTETRKQCECLKLAWFIRPSNARFYASQ